MKIFLILSLSMIFTNIALFCQKSISPNVNTEFCPLVNQTFTVTIPLIKSGTDVTLSVIGTPTIVTGVTSLSSSGSVTTFTFVGRFSDDNNIQSFRADFTKADNTADNYLMEFKKIKSLKFNSIPSTINTNIPEINSAPCQITTHNLSFTNIRFGNAFDATISAFGIAITSYEYLLPVDWKIDNTTSTGNWILADNSVTITSDLGTGDGGSIQIRALNTDCGITLSKSPIKTIPIRRPKPLISFTGSPTICNSNTFNSNNIPSWVTNYTWQLTPSNLGIISGTNPVTISRQTDGYGQLSLLIGATGCPSFNYNTSEILPGVSELFFGTPAPNYYTIYGNDPNDGGRFGRITMTVNSYGPGATYKFYVNNILRRTTTVNTWGFVPDACDIDFEVSCLVENACGQAPYAVGHTVYFPCINFFRVSNIANSNLISVESTSPKRDVMEIKVFDRSGNQKMTKRYNIGTKKVQLDISALAKNYYVIMVSDGTISKSFNIIR